MLSGENCCILITYYIDSSMKNNVLRVPEGTFGRNTLRLTVRNQIQIPSGEGSRDGF